MQNPPLKDGWIRDVATGKPVDARKPEEAIRQLYEKELHDDYGYDYAQMDIEVSIQHGEAGNRKNKTEKADLVVYHTINTNRRAQHQDILGIVETKRPSRKEGIKQLASDMSATSCQWGVWTNGNEIEYLYRDAETGRIQRDFIFQIPKRGESFKDIGRISKEHLQPSNKLKIIFKRLLNTLYANTNISRREKLGTEMIRLLFCKIWDESYDPNVLPAFRVGFDEKPEQVAERIRALFKKVRDDFSEEGVFDANEEIKLDDRSIAYVVGQLDRYSLLKSNKDVIGDAFEVFAESKLVGEKGEFFTPREVVKMAVRVVDPKPRQTVCDPACGSGGFLIYAVEHIWKSMQQDRQWKGLSEETLRREQRKMAERSFYGIDKEIDLVKITKAYMSIIGDGKSKVVQENTLHEPCEYNPRAKMLFVQDEATHTIRKFDCILTNPPFGSKIKVLEADSGQFELGYKWKEIEGVWHKTDEIKKTEPQVLFIERCLQMLRTEGKLQQEFITMGVCEGIGHDHNGKPLYRYDENKKHFTEEIWDNSIDIMEELKAPSHPDNHYVFRVPTRNIKGSVYVPRYYWKKYSVQIEERAKKEHFQLVSIQKLLDEGIIQSFAGHGSPEARFKGLGDIPYVRVADIMNWSIYKNPTAFIPAFEYQRVKGNGSDLKEGDVLFVRRGSLYLLSHTLTQKQINSKVLTDTTLPTIGDRWKELKLPVANDATRRKEIKEKIKHSFLKKWAGQQEIESLAQQFGDLTT
ncbi:restriction endonuclease subunit M [Candidatus Glomeribacter gigasporarum]|nr:N-6 DNA methylase [Candidatus Glomeribacter gigasporarum]